MKQKEWEQEVATAIAGGLPWRVLSAWLDQGSHDCCADLVDERTGKQRSVRLSRLTMSTAALRRQEIRRQLQAQ